jgi:lipoprotein-anchoring transpeptidase ErfK/SrfK
MRTTFKATLIALIFGLFISGCRNQTGPSQAVATSTPAPATSTNEAVPITLPVLDALFADEAFTKGLKGKLQLSDDQISRLRKISRDAVTKLHQRNAENQSGSAQAARENAIEAIRGVIGAEKSEQLMALARERWNKGGESEAAVTKEAEPTMLPGPNAVPTDTRIVVNIPAFRMDVFANGSLVKSYKIGIGYPQFPLPQGLRKAEMIIFNPTWTPPDSPWVNTMNVTPGEVIGAGSKQNPLGPIKIPIGSPSLIHGGKQLAKIGTFASHGCVGMTNAQVKDFAKILADAGHAELTEETMSAYLKNRTRTRTVKLGQIVPVELRYETIVFEEGKLHIYRDVYDQNTNTEENLRAVFAANGANFDKLAQEEKAKVVEALNAMSRHPMRQPTPKPTPKTANDGVQDSANAAVEANDRGAEAERQKKLRNQREFVIEVVELAGKGYPAPVNLDSGAGTQLGEVAPPPNKP